MAGLLSENSWMGKTGQGWKAIAFLFLIFVDLCVFSLLVWRINNRTNPSEYIPNEITLSLSFVGLGVVALSWLWLSIRCPECKQSVAGYVMKHSPASNWFTTLLILSHCPCCGSAASDSISR
jgi:hypothetical protein